MASPNNGRNLGGLTTNREQTRSRLHQKFKVHFSEPSKVTARRVELSAETVDLYKQANVPEAWATFAAVCRANPHFALDVLVDLGIDLDNDRDAYAQFLSMKRTMMQGGGK
jgi:hypothetical protein